MNLTLDTYFDKIFFINLNSDDQRREKMIRQFNQWRISNYERIEAIQLKGLPKEWLYRNFNKKTEKYILGSASCRASHLKCVALAKERHYKRVLILEDDVDFLQDPANLIRQNYLSLADWDMLYFGGLVEPFFRSQIVCAHAYGVSMKLYDDILHMAEPSGMEIDNFYAKVLQHMSYNYNPEGKYTIKMVHPFNQIVQNKSFGSNIQH